MLFTHTSRMKNVKLKVTANKITKAFKFIFWLSYFFLEVCGWYSKPETWLCSFTIVLFSYSCFEGGNIYLPGFPASSNLHAFSLALPNSRNYYKSTFGLSACILSIKSCFICETLFRWSPYFYEQYTVDIFQLMNSLRSKKWGVQYNYAIKMLWWA